MVLLNQSLIMNKLSKRDTVFKLINESSYEALLEVAFACTSMNLVIFKTAKVWSQLTGCSNLLTIYWLINLSLKLIFDGHNDTFRKTRDNLLRWLVGLKPIQLEQQKTQFLLIILAKKTKSILYRVIKSIWKSLNWK